MKRTISTLILLSCFISLLSVPTASAIELFADEEVQLNASEEPVNDTAILLGNTINQENRVEGDVWAMGNTIMQTGAISNNLFAAGSDIHVKAEVGDDVYLAGTNVIITDHVHGAAYLIGSNIKILGNIEGPAYIYGQDVRIEGFIRGPVHIEARKITLTKTAKLDGNLNYVSPVPPLIDPDAITKEVVRGEYEDSDLIPGGAFHQIISLLSLLLVGFLLLKIKPTISKKTIQSIQGELWASLGIGTIYIIVVPIISLFLVVSYIGLPLGLMLAAGYLISIYIAQIFCAYFLGTAIQQSSKKKKQWSEIQVLLIGLLAYKLIGFIPILGPLAIIVLTLISLGAMIQVGRDTILLLQKKQLL